MMPQAPELNTANQRLKQTLAAAASAELETAGEKMRNTSYWGEVGFIEAAAVERACAILEAVPPSLAPDAYIREIERRFNEQIAIYRRDDALDPDGYGLGTFYAILRKAGLDYD